MGTPQPGARPDGDLVADVVGPAGLVLGADHVEAELSHLATFAVDRWDRRRLPAAGAS